MADLDMARVLFLDQSGQLGGAELSLLDLAASRARGGAGDTVQLLADGPFAERLREAGVETAVSPLRIDVQKSAGLKQLLAAVPRAFGVARRVAATARDHNLIYANTQKAAVIGGLAAWLSGRPFVWHLRDMLDAGHFSRANRVGVVALTNRTASRVVANSQATADAYRRAGGTVETQVIYNGIAPVVTDSLADAAARVRASLGLPDGTPLVGAFGRLTPWKGQHVLLDALAGEALRHTHAVLVGDALFTDEDRRYASELHERATDERLAGRIHVLGQRDDVPTLMKACDVIVHSACQPEPFGRVLVEGMLAERPVVAADAGGPAEIIEHGRTGLLTPPGDAEALADALARLIGDPAFAASLAVAGRDDAHRRFGLERCVDEVNALIDRVVSEGRRCVR